MYQEPEGNTSSYRDTAETLRRLAGELRFDLCRAKQLRALADAFERLAERQRAGKQLVADAAD